MPRSTGAVVRGVEVCCHLSFCPCSTARCSCWWSGRRASNRRRPDRCPARLWPHQHGSSLYEATGRACAPRMQPGDGNVALPDVPALLGLDEAPDSLRRASTLCLSPRRAARQKGCAAMQPASEPVRTRGDTAPHPGNRMHLDRSAGRTASRFGAGLLAYAAQFSAAGASADAGSGVRAAADRPDARASTAAAEKFANGHTHRAGRASGIRPASSVPEPAVLAQARVNVSDGQRVGVGMPISVTFARPVPVTERKAFR
ncbi:Ig-like domain-containing protein [Streptomyces sp. NPDC005209]|uniref:Ig-like domain-containing protein n=1 Tax=Streptomyces sp. NPDC005209 TaxID=3156715 RepID=UPI0033ABEFA6